MDAQHLVIDLTDAALARHRATTSRCHRCAVQAELYRLIGTTEGLCAGCFTDVHVS